ncbi:MAG TPA: tRNA lysidine(34) synthetase TilS, partial [Clostridia bacterium]|nr:tRNA lysidine(34) synthetase TilS [Clostridia bacterium]
MVKTLGLNAELLKEKNIAVAVSGGRDSMALLHLFSKSNLSFFAVNIEHGIRGEESLRDSKFVADFCQENGILIKSFSVDAPAYANQNHMTLEQSARELRYQIFDILLSSNECDLIALAHHLDDQAETVLMRILR